MPNLCIIPARALKDDSLTPTQLRVLLAVGLFTSRDGSGVWASNATLADVAGLQVRHMREALRALVEKGYVRKIQRPGRTAVMGIVLDDPLEVPCTKEVQGTLHDRSAPGCTKLVHRTTSLATHRNDPPPPRAKSVAELLVAEHHRIAYRTLLDGNPRARASIDYELRLAAEGGERPGVGMVQATGWERVGEALHQLLVKGQAFSSRSLGTFLGGLDPLPSAPAAPAAPAKDYSFLDAPDPFAEVPL